MVQAIMTWTALAQAWTVGTAFDIFDTLNAARLLTTMQAMILMIIVTMLVLPLIQFWLRHGEIGYGKTIFVSVVPALFLVTLLLTPSGFIGAPDENCDKYDNGKLTYGLVTFIAVPKSSEDLYGAGWLVLIVRSNERWGDNTHQCRLSLADPKVKDLMGHLAQLQLTGGSGFSRENVTFVFGGRNEVPNVKVHSLEPDPKSDPPEVPESKKHNI